MTSPRWEPRERTVLERRARMTKPRRRHAYHLAQHPAPEPPEPRVRIPAEPMGTVVRQGHYAALGRGALTPAQRRRIRHKQPRELARAG